MISETLSIIKQNEVALRLSSMQMAQLYALLEGSEAEQLLEIINEQLAQQNYNLPEYINPIAYRDFKNLQQVEDKLGVTIQDEHLFPSIIKVQPSQRLATELADAEEYSPVSEKERSEWIIQPILSELRRINHNSFHIYSGRQLNVDAEKGLRGECDFMYGSRDKPMCCANGRCKTIQ